MIRKSWRDVSMIYNMKLMKIIVKTYLIKLNYIRMSHNLENVDLTSDSFNITLIFDFVLFQNLNSNFFAGNQMCSKSYFTKCTLSKWSAYINISNWNSKCRKNKFLTGICQNSMKKIICFEAKIIKNLKVEKNLLLTNYIVSNCSIGIWVIMRRWLSGFGRGKISRFVFCAIIIISSIWWHNSAWSYGCRCWRARRSWFLIMCTAVAFIWLWISSLGNLLCVAIVCHYINNYLFIVILYWFYNKIW